MCALGVGDMSKDVQSSTVTTKANQLDMTQMKRSVYVSIFTAQMTTELLVRGINTPVRIEASLWGEGSESPGIRTAFSASSVSL